MVRTHQIPNNLKLILFVTLLALNNCQSPVTNGSLCTDIELNQLHYNLNAAQNNFDQQMTTDNGTIIYNYCQQVQVYCPYENAVVAASLVAINTLQRLCLGYVQTSVSFLDGVNGSNGIKVVYVLVGGTTQNDSIVFNYPCTSTNVIGCPSVDSSIMWQYFSKHVLVYTIVIEIVGIILMVLGIYIYRGSIVLIGWGTSFIILIMIQSLFVFLRGVPDSLIQNVLILTIICSFFVGYILGYFPKAGVFCMGLWIGFVIALTLNNIALYYINSNPPNLALYIVLPILSIGFAILTLYIKKTFIVFASSLIGSYLCLRALSWHLGAFPNQFILSQKYHLGLEGPVPWQFYLYVVALGVLTTSSSALQSWLFKKKLRKNKQSEDIEEHLDQMQNTMKKQRENLIDIKSVFQNQGAKKPRVLAKVGKVTKQQRESDEEQKSVGESEQESLPAYKSDDGQDEEQQVVRNLKKGLISGKGRKP